MFSKLFGTKKETRYATTIQCGKCVARVKPVLDTLAEVEAWSVDTADERKVLTVRGTALPEAVAEALAAVGYSATVIQDK
jgi:copper chaperone CopZ